MNTIVFSSAHQALLLSLLGLPESRAFVQASHCLPSNRSKHFFSLTEGRESEPRVEGMLEVFELGVLDAALLVLYTRIDN
jgi:hypothetical protein